MFIMRSIFIIIVSILTLSCISTPEKKADNTAEFKGKVFDINTDSTPIIDTIDFGIVKRGEMVEKTLRFKNTATEKPLVFLSHESSCGCTSIQYDKQPIAPNQYKDVTFNFNSKVTGTGHQLKLVKIHTSFMSKPCKFYVMAQVK